MSNQQTFIDSLVPYAQKIQALFNIPASITIAQAIHESAWGRSTPKDVYTGRDSFNLFGIKGEGTAGSVKSKTWEVVNGKRINIFADFRAYNDFGDSLQGYADLMMTKRYRDIFSGNSLSVYNQVEKIQQAGYATDPSYATKVNNIISSYNLTQYDKEGTTVNNPINTLFPNMPGLPAMPGAKIGEKIVEDWDKVMGTDIEAPPNTVARIPIPFSEPIFITKDGLFSTLAVGMGIVVLILVLYKWFLSDGVNISLGGDK